MDTAMPDPTPLSNADLKKRIETARREGMKESIAFAEFGHGWDRSEFRRLWLDHLHAISELPPTNNKPPAKVEQPNLDKKEK